MGAFDGEQAVVVGAGVAGSAAARVLVAEGATVRVSESSAERSGSAELRAEGIEVARPISDQGWGLLTAITLPGGVELGLYQPRHPTATQPG